MKFWGVLNTLKAFERIRAATPIETTQVTIRPIKMYRIRLPPRFGVAAGVVVIVSPYWKKKGTKAKYSQILVLCACHLRSASGTGHCLCRRALLSNPSRRRFRRVRANQSPGRNSPPTAIEPRWAARIPCCPACDLAESPEQAGEERYKRCRRW